MEEAAIALNAIVALLPEEYKVEVNTIKYNSIIKGKTLICCPFCGEEPTYDDVKFFEMILPFIDQCLIQSTTQKVWVCPKCKTISPISKSRIKTIEFQKPFYIKVVPEAPRIGRGLSTRLGYREKFIKWFETVLEELENQIGMYRADYQAQQEGLEQPLYDEDED